MKQKMTIIFIFVFLPFLLNLYYEYINGNSDVKGWWQVIILYCIITCIVYSVLFVVIEQILPFKLGYTVCFSIIMCLFLVFYLMSRYWFSIDFLIQNKLTWIQSFYSKSLYLYFMISLLIHLVLKLYIKNRRNLKKGR